MKHNPTLNQLFLQGATISSAFSPCGLRRAQGMDRRGCGR
jgi:hypothetical protein